MSDAAIEIAGLRKEFRRGKEVTVAVDGLDLRVERGEIFGLLGPNGAGKTTTVEICEGLQEPSAGSVQVLGRRFDQGGGQAIRERIGVSLQETRFFDKQTVREILELFRSFYASGRSVDELIAMFSLEEKAGTRSGQLSGGQRQRLAVACALVGEPELLFLDEPTTGLDPQSRRQLWDAIRAYQQGGGTVLLTTHYMEEAEQLCTRLGIVDHGKRIALDSPRRLIASLGGAHTVELRLPSGGARAEALGGLPGVASASFADGWLSLATKAPHELIPALLAWLAEQGEQLEELRTRQTSLEDVFVQLTGRHLRDEEAA